MLILYGRTCNVVRNGSHLSHLLSPHLILRVVLYVNVYFTFIVIEWPMINLLRFK